MHESLHRLTKTISAYDPTDLLASIAALQLIPGNALHMARLEAFAHLAASLRAKPREARIGSKKLPRIRNSPPLNPLSFMTCIMYGW